MTLLHKTSDELAECSVSCKTWRSVCWAKRNRPRPSREGQTKGSTTFPVSLRTRNVYRNQRKSTTTLLEKQSRRHVLCKQISGDTEIRKFVCVLLRQQKQCFQHADLFCAAIPRILFNKFQGESCCFECIMSWPSANAPSPRGMMQHVHGMHSCEHAGFIHYFESFLQQKHDATLSENLSEAIRGLIHDTKQRTVILSSTRGIGKSCLLNSMLETTSISAYLHSRKQPSATQPYNSNLTYQFASHQVCYALLIARRVKSLTIFF